REIEGGQIENVYRLQVMNTSEAPRAFRLSVLGIPGIGIPDEAVIEVDGAASRLVPVRVRIERGAVAAGTHRIEFGIQSTDDPGVAVREKSVFIVR
ncbi:MAG: cytochrome c oxidase accessory protein CcoG, partial [Betaproteobacteria bacterium]|nr:cytochrome c oxidase accessory protein CcoG [Betaproteobacteria bacterium]